MNCRPGDLAVLVRSYISPESVGKVVRCLSAGKTFEGVDFWYVSPMMHAPKKLNGRFYPGNTACDAHLRPIRDSDGEDEMLRIAGKPQEVNA